MAGKTISKLTILIGARSDKLRKDLRNSNQAVRNFDRSIERSAPKLVNWGMAARRAAAGAASLAAAVGALNFVKLAADAETARVSFSVLLGSADAAKKMLEEIREFATSTPFSQSDIVGSARMLLGVGEAAQDVLPTLRRLGDVAALSGLSIEELTFIYSRARTGTVLFNEDINQLAGRGLPVFQEFAKQLGVSASEIKKLASEGKISFSNLQQMFIDLTKSGGMYADGMKRLSQTLEGRWRTLVDQVKTLATNLGETLMPAMKATVEMTINVVESIKKLDIGMVRAGVQITAFTAAFAAAVAYGPKVIGFILRVVDALRTLQKAKILVNSVTLAGATGTVVALAIGAAAAQRAGKEFDKLAASLQDTKKGAEVVSNETKKTAENVKAAGDAAKASAKEMEEAFDKWQQKWQGIGDSLTQRFRTPFEKLRDSIAEARTALDAGTISLATFERASNAAFKEFEQLELKRRDFQVRPVGAAAASAGSQAAFDAIARHAGRMTAERQRINQEKRLADRRDELLRRLNEGQESVAEAVRQNKIIVKKTRI